MNINATMKKQFIYIFFALVCSFSASLQAQEQVTWEILGQVQYKAYYNIGAGEAFQKPKFSPTIKKLDGQEVIIKGYMMPLDVDGNIYVLSANPYAACFFCGGAGPESVMELWLKDTDKRYKMDQIVTFKGKFMVNSEPYGLCYILQDADPVD